MTKLTQLNLAQQIYKLQQLHHHQQFYLDRSDAAVTGYNVYNSGNRVNDSAITDQTYSNWAYF
jgi:hypothetical protein